MSNSPALDWLTGLLQRDPQAMGAAQANPALASSALDLIQQAVGTVNPGVGLGMQVGQHALEAGTALGQTGMGLAYPEGVTVPTAPLLGPAAFLPGMPGQPLGGLNPRLGLEQAATAYQQPMAYQPVHDASRVGTLAEWTPTPNANPLERLGYVGEQARATEQRAPEQFPGMKFAGESALNPISYVGWGLSGKAAAAAPEGSRLASVLGELQQGENLWNATNTELLKTLGSAALRVPGVAGAVERVPAAAMGAVGGSTRAFLDALDTATAKFPQLQGTGSSMRLMASMPQQGQAEARAAITAAGVSEKDLGHLMSQAYQDKREVQAAIALVQPFKPGVGTAMDLAGTRAQLEARAGITAAATDDLLARALPRITEADPARVTSADVRNAVLDVLTEDAAASGVTRVEKAAQDLPMKAAQLAWLQERYGPTIPATFGTAPAGQEAAVAARLQQTGGAAAGAGAPTSPGAAAPPDAEARLRAELQKMGINPESYMPTQPVPSVARVTRPEPAGPLWQSPEERAAYYAAQDARLAAPEAAPPAIPEAAPPAEPPAPPTSSGAAPLAPEAAPSFTPTGPAPAVAPLPGAGAPSVAPDVTATGPVRSAEDMLASFRQRFPTGEPGLQVLPVGDRNTTLLYRGTNGQVIGAAEVVTGFGDGPTVLSFAVDPAVGLQRGRAAQALGDAVAAMRPTSLGTEVSPEAAQFVNRYLARPGAPEVRPAAPERAPAAPLAPEPAPSTLQGPVGRTVTAGTADATTQIETRYRVVELDALTPSHTDAFAPNPAYPAALQPRDRGRAAMQAQTQEIARGLNPDALLTDAHELDRGPMIVGPDGIVESGNGRVMALRQAQALAPDRLASYEAELRARLPEYGIDESALAGLQHPVLIRERVTPLDDPARQALTKTANVPQTATMAPTEQARSDAALLPPEAVAGLDVAEGQSLDAALRKQANAPLGNSFLQGLAPAERSALVDPGGALNQAGLIRLKNALISQAFPGEAGQKLVTSFRESLDPEVLQIQKGIEGALPDLIRAQALVDSGQRDAGLSLSEDLATAVNVIARLRENRISLTTYMQRAEWARETTPEQERLLELLDTTGRRPTELKAWLQRYAGGVEAAPPPAQGVLPGMEAPAVSKGGLFDAATSATERAPALAPAEAAAAAPAEGPQLAGGPDTGASGGLAPAPAAPPPEAVAPPDLTPAAQDALTRLQTAHTALPEAEQHLGVPLRDSGLTAAEANSLQRQGLAQSFGTGKARRILPTGPEPSPDLPPIGGAAPTMEETLAARANLAPDLVRMAPGSPEFKQNLLDAAPDYVTRYDAAKYAAEKLQTDTGLTLRELAARKDLPQQQAARDLLGQTGGADILTDAENDVYAHMVMADYAKANGITFSNPNVAQRWASNAMGVWRQLAIFSPRFWVRNGIDGASRSLIYTGTLGLDHPTNPLGAAADESYWQIWPRAWRESAQGAVPTDYPGSFAQPILDLHDWRYPSSVTGGQAATIWQQGRGLERLPGLGRVFRFFRNVYQAQETSMRLMGAVNGSTREVPKALPELESSLRSALGDQADDVLARLAPYDGQLNSRTFLDVLDAAGVQGPAHEAATAAFGAFQTRVVDAGINFSHKLYINYQDTRRIDQMLSNFFGFHVYATRSIPFYLETLATHPLLLQGMVDYYENRKAAAKAGGYEKNRKLEYAVPVASGDDWMTLLFGQNGTAFVDPTGYASIMENGLRAMDTSEQSDPEARGTQLVGHLLNVLNSAGFGAAPWITAPAGVAGAFGGQQPRALFPQEGIVTGAVQAVTGKPVELPWTAAQRARIGPFADRVANDPAMTVRIRIAQKAMELAPEYAAAHPTAPIHPRAISAMVNGAGDPLYDDASKEVGHQKFAETTLRWFGLPVAFQGHTEAAIAQIEAALPEVNADSGGLKHPLLPTVPRSNYQPGQPIVTYDTRNAAAQQLAAQGHPEAVALQPAFRRNVGEPGGALGASGQSAVAQAVAHDYATADPQRRQALLTSPTTRPYVLDYLAGKIHLQMAPLPTR